MIFTLIAFLFVANPAVHAAAAPTRIPVILDMDMLTNGEEGGAEASLFAADLQGQANVIAIGVNTPYTQSVSTVAWKCIAAIAQFYGYPNVPIGSDMPDNAAPPSDDFISPCAAFASPKTPAPQSVVALYRKALVAQPDGSVVIVETGYEENIDALLNSPPDAISPLSGKALIAQKVKVLEVMGGGYPTWPTGETNFKGHAGSAEDVAANWPSSVNIVYAGWEVGNAVLSGSGVTSHDPSNSPLRALMTAYAGANKNVTSFDLIPVFHMLAPADPSLTETGPGTNAIASAGTNTFTMGPGHEYYLTLNTADLSSLESSLNSLWDQLPGSTHQSLTFTSTPPPTPIVGGTYQTSFLPGASGNPVTLTIDPTSTSGCTIDSSDLVHFSPPFGTCLIDANEPGDTTYAPATALQSLQVAGIPQVITYTSTPPSSPTVGDTYNVSASGGASPNPVVITIDKTSTSGCTLSGSKVTLSAPRGTCVIDANQLGTTTFAAATQVQQTISVGGKGQTVTFSTIAPIHVRVGNAPYAPSATASSGLSVSITIDPLSRGCSLKGSAVAFTGVGTCLVDATQGGDTTFVPAESQQSIAIAKGLNVLTITSHPPKASAGGTYTPLAKTTSRDVVHLSLGSHSSGCAVQKRTVTFRAVGTCIVVVADHGSVNYIPASATQTISIGMGHVHLEVVSTPASARSGQTFSLAGTVSVPFATGVVTFTVQGKVLCAAALRDGVATCRTAISLPSGAHRIVGTYSGSGSFFSTMGAITLRLT